MLYRQYSTYISPAYDPISNMLANFGTLTLIKIHTVIGRCAKFRLQNVSQAMEFRLSQYAMFAWLPPFDNSP